MINKLLPKIIGGWSISFILLYIWLGKEPNLLIRLIETAIGFYGIFFIRKDFIEELKKGCLI